MTLREFYDKLQRFDWFYTFSDSNSVVREGQAAESRLSSEAARLGPEYLNLFNSYHDSLWSGPTFGTELIPLPKKPD